jgi:hypothetical protein
MDAEYMTEREFLEAVARAEPNRAIKYFTGALATEAAAAGGIKKLAKTAMKLCMQGHVHLTQRRISESIFEYLATLRT